MTEKKNFALHRRGQDVPELGEGYPDGAPLLSLLAVPSALAQEEAEHLADGGASIAAAFPLEVGARSLALSRRWERRRECAGAALCANSSSSCPAHACTSAAKSITPVPACLL